jgi:hypothetical protein
VSAKSLLFTARLDEGAYNAVRNAADIVVKACEEALDLSDFLRKNPAGDNYDLSEFSSIDVVVCLPYAVYVPIGSATRNILEGLRAAVALSELEEFLRK